MMTLEVRHISEVLYPGTPKNAAAVWRRKFKQFGLVREELQKNATFCSFPHPGESDPYGYSWAIFYGAVRVGTANG